MDPSEDNLVARAVGGDEDALSKLLLQCDGELRECVGGQIGKRYQGAFGEDDVIQVTYMEAFLRIGLFERDGDRSFLNWLRRIADNNIRDAIRHLDRQKRPPRHRQLAAAISDDSYETLLATLSGSQTTPSQRAARREVHDLLEDALGKLPPDYEKVVRMYDLQGFSAPEISKQIGRSAGAIHMLKARAHEQLAEILGCESGFFSNPA